MATSKKRPAKTVRNLKRRSKILSNKLALGIIMLGVVAGGALVWRLTHAASTTLINPTHFVDAQWYFPAKTNGYDSHEVTITPRAAAGADGYFAAHTVYLANGTPAYIGLQNNGSEPSGKIAVFSVWNAQNASGPQYARTFGGEGIGYSARISYPWQVNRSYRVKIYKVASSGAGDWWAGSVTDLATNSVSYIGKIQAARGAGNLDTATISFHERFSGSINNCTNMEQSITDFTNPKANGLYGPDDRRDSISPVCSGYHNVQAITGGFRSTIGKVGGGDKFTSSDPTVVRDALNGTYVVGGSNSYCPADQLVNKGSGKKSCNLKTPVSDFYYVTDVATNVKGIDEFCFSIIATSPGAKARMNMTINKHRVMLEFAVPQRLGDHCMSLVGLGSNNNATDNAASIRMLTGTGIVYGGRLR